MVSQYFSMIADTLATRRENRPMPRITALTHPALGRLVRLEGLSAQPLALTPQEATTIARALTAVRAGRSTETEIYLSPIASDDSFQALVEPDGVRCAGRHLPWPEVDTLAEDLARAAETNG
jgi:hypothetical protein